MRYRPRRIWPWFIASAVVVILAIGIWAVTTNKTKQPTQLAHIQVSVRASLWHPDPAYWCAGKADLVGPFPDRQMTATLVNSAPTKEARLATLAFYNDLVAGRSTTTDLANVNASHTCISKNGEPAT